MSTPKESLFEKLAKGAFWQVTRTLIMSLFLCAAPFLCYGDEMKAIGLFWYIILAKALMALCVISCVGVVVLAKDYGRDFLRKVAIALAVIAAVICLIPASQYRQDKKDNIHFDKVAK